MKTRQEMIYDFMVALTSNTNVVNQLSTPSAVYNYASALVDEYLRSLG